MKRILLILAVSGAFFSQIAQAQNNYIPGQYVVKWRKGYLKTFSHFEKNQLGVIKNLDEQENYSLVYRPAPELVSHSLKSLAALSAVELVEPNYIYKINKFPNDAQFSNSWGLINSGQADSKGNKGQAGIDINIQNVWDKVTETDILVAVIDTGVDYRHPELKDNIFVNQKEETGVKGVDDDGNGYIDDVYGMDFTDMKNPKANALDDHGHGSHCSGIIGAKGDNLVGTTGVNWNIKILPVRFLDAEGSGSLAGAVAAIDYAVKMGAKVLSNSWGGTTNSAILQEMVESTANKGVLFVVAAGNETADLNKSKVYPASYQTPNMISVAAITNKGKLASFSNYGSQTVDLAAPGENIYSTLLNGKYDSWSGTSMATPFVSGIAALIWGQNPGLTNLELKNRIMTTVKLLPTLRTKVISKGMVDAQAAFENIPSQIDSNDPSGWAQEEYRLSSDHPYSKKSKWEKEIQLASEVTQFALYFEKFDTEVKYDKLSIYDSAGHLVQVIDGNFEKDYSGVVTGNYAKLVFESDDSVEKYGFDITAVAVKK